MSSYESCLLYLVKRCNMVLPPKFPPPPTKKSSVVLHGGGSIIHHSITSQIEGWGNSHVDYCECVSVKATCLNSGSCRGLTLGVLCSLCIWMATSLVRRFTKLLCKSNLLLTRTK